MAKKLFIKTYGCQMNVYDSARMADVLAPLGYAPADAPDGADMVILNTCHIREKAAEKVFSELGRLKRHKDAQAADGKKMIIAVAGCVAQAEGEEIIRRQPAVDIVLGPQTYHRLGEMVARATRGAGQVLDTDFPVESKFDFLPDEAAPQGKSAFLTVQEGCDKFCSFCVVPYTRGSESSRPVAAVVAEAERLVGQGAMEICLLGQNVNAYHGLGPEGQSWGLGQLIRRLAEIPGLLRLRYTTSHPRDMDDGLIAAHRNVGVLMPYLHLPVQSGSDKILRAMNRQHGRDDYLRLADKIRAARPDIALTSDFIVGFPGETDQDFAATLDLVRQVGYAGAYSFKYSPRPGTPAALAETQVPEPVKEERLAALQALLAEQTAAFNQACVGKRFDVIFDRPGRRPGQWLGRSPYLQPVHVTGGDELRGTRADVIVTSATPVSLGARLASAGDGAAAA